MHAVGKEIGFLPGDKSEKLEPWIAPIKDNLKFLLSGNEKKHNKDFKSFNSHIDSRNIDYLFEEGIIEIEAMTYIRGRSLNNCFIIIDESQNLNHHEIKAILTRAGHKSKIVLTGDIEQTDRMDVDSISNGLSVVIEKFKEYDLHGHVTLTQGLRSELATLASKIL
jgi:PhoH-like ATPase